MPNVHHMFHHASVALADRARDRVRELPHARPAPRPRVLRHRLLPEALAAGAIGATVAALWVLVADLFRGAPFDTPATLGAYVTHALGSSGWRGASRLAATFTGLEYALFVLVGVIAVALVHRARNGGGLRIALAAIVGALVTPLAALFTIAGTSAVDAAVWLQVAAGHLAAVGAMGWYLWRTHPHLWMERLPAHRVRIPRRRWTRVTGSPAGSPGSLEMPPGGPGESRSGASPSDRAAAPSPAGGTRAAQLRAEQLLSLADGRVWGGTRRPRSSRRPRRGVAPAAQGGQ